jgi:hypothetical protein
MQPVPYEYVAALAEEYGAVQCCWRESDRAFTGFVAEIWFAAPAGEFAQRWAKIVGRTLCLIDSCCFSRLVSD